MSNLYAELMRLQTIPDAYSSWRSYRNGLTRLITGRTAPGSTALIVGAGRCCDLDLLRLQDHFSGITLLDKDLSAMEEGVRAQGGSIGAVRLLRVDLLGISDEVYTGIADRMTAMILPSLRSGEAGASAFTDAFLREIRSAWTARRPDSPMIPPRAADYVICCGVHSQLMTVFPRMAGVYARYVPIDTGPVLSLVRSLVPEAVRSLNDDLFRWAKDGVLIGLEDPESAIDGAWQAARDLSGRGLSDPRSEVLIWPFDKSRGKTYPMRVSLFSV